MAKTDYTKQQFGNRLIIKNYCTIEDWVKIGKPVPKNTDRYVLGKCLNCGAIIPTDKKNMIRQPPKRCVFCSNIGNHYNVPVNTNSWVLRDDIAICNVIYNKQVISFVIDADRYNEVKQYIWRISKKKNKYYVISGSMKKNTMIYLHQLIMGEIKDGFEIDHIDGNSLNNRQSNLRFVTHQENVDNIQATRIDNTIGIRGISYDKRGKKYTVDFYYHGKRFYFKLWSTLGEAIYCRYCLEQQFGLNLIEKNPLVRNYQLPDINKQNEIKQYVLKKIS